MTCFDNCEEEFDYDVFVLSDEEEEEEDFEEDFEEEIYEIPSEERDAKIEEFCTLHKALLHTVRLLHKNHLLDKLYIPYGKRWNFAIAEMVIDEFMEHPKFKGNPVPIKDIVLKLRTILDDIIKIENSLAWT